MPFPPNSELVAVHWLKGVAGLPPSNVSTTLPGADNASFAASGWVQATSVGGVPDAYTGMQASRIQVDLWAFNANSNKVPWGRAMTLASYIKLAIDGADPARLVVTPEAFDNAWVHMVKVATDPRRLPDEAFARYSMDITVNWTRRV